MHVLQFNVLIDRFRDQLRTISPLPFSQGIKFLDLLLRGSKADTGAGARAGHARILAYFSVRHVGLSRQEAGTIGPHSPRNPADSKICDISSVSRSPSSPAVFGSRLFHTQSAK